MVHNALLAWRSPPRLSRWRWTLPEEACRRLIQLLCPFSSSAWPHACGQLKSLFASTCRAASCCRQTDVPVAVRRCAASAPDRHRRHLKGDSRRLTAPAAECCIARRLQVMRTVNYPLALGDSALMSAPLKKSIFNACCPIFATALLHPAHSEVFPVPQPNTAAFLNICRIQREIGWLRPGIFGDLKRCRMLSTPVDQRQDENTNLIDKPGVYK